MKNENEEEVYDPNQNYTIQVRPGKKTQENALKKKVVDVATQIIGKTIFPDA